MTTDAPLRLVLDTNQWRSQYGLNSAVGAALLHAVQQVDGRIVLPEVIESELTKHLVKEGIRAADQVKQGLHLIRTLTGSAPDPPLPDGATIRQAVTSRLHELSGVMDKMPLSIEQSRRALSRVNDQNPPSKNKEQFKDSLL